MALPNAAQAATFTVTRLDDPAPGACQADDCSLREAVQQANSDPASADEIILPAGSYTLTRVAGDDTAANGDLDITGPVLIDGEGADATVVRQTVVDRVFDMRQVQTAGSIQLEEIGITGGDRGGVRAATDFTRLVITDSAVFGNTNTLPGGGLELRDILTGSPTAISGTTISGNSAPRGGGMWVNNGVVTALENTTISGNSATGSGGGGAIMTETSNGSPEGTASLLNVTVTANSAPSGAGGAFANDGTINLENTIVSGNSGGNCALSDPTSQGNNIENGTSCGLSGTGDLNANPQLSALADNGGGTQTHALAASSPAVDAAEGCPPPGTDQRGVSRPQGSDCDIGAYEFVASKTVPSVPDCSRSTQITLTMDPPAGETPVAFKFKIDDGPTQTAQTSDETAEISLPGEGRFKLEYWSQTSAGEEPQSNHLVDTAIVDQTDPTLSVASDQNQNIYVIKRNATVTVQAGDALSGLEVNPSAQEEPVGTGSRGLKTVQWTAQDRCDNQATTQFQYFVLGPGLGERAVIEPLGDDVEVRVAAAGGARASQAADFVPVTQPREIPIRSTIDTRGGRARITSSKSGKEGDIQDGVFASGIFQVLQSRRERSKGLTKLNLKGGSFANCTVGKGASSARLRRRAVRRLRGNAKGRFRTRGRHSAATVRGTKWTVTDRCDGTLTSVRRGRVAVRDFRAKKTVVLSRGKRYLALAEPIEPVLGKTVSVETVKGRVFVKLPARGGRAHASQKGRSFVPLTAARSVPVRSILDTRRGTVALRSARNRKGRIQSGRFSGGVFQVAQSRKRRAKGLTELRLKGSAAKFRRCGKGSGSAQAALSRRAIRRLRARAKGRYRTRGRHSAATVRGTVWTTTDSCAGTLTSVRRGKVAVRDLRRKRTVVLAAGKSYLARPG